MELSEAQSSSGLVARQFAVRLLRAVLQQKQPFDDTFAVLASARPYSDLAPRDRAFAYAISAMSLRRLGQIETVIPRFLDRPMPGDAVDAHLILVSAVAQLVFMDVAPHAAISLAVDQAKASTKTQRFAGLINAVLRRVAAASRTIAEEQDGLAFNTPEWLRARWERNYGVHGAAKIAAAHLVEPPLDLSVKDDPSAWAARFEGEVLPWGPVRFAAKGRIEDMDGYADGAWWVQDAAASIPALLLGDVTGLRVADLCAAPGGKTAQLVARGAQVTSVDMSAGRLRRLRENLSRLKLEADIVQADIMKWQPDGLFDAILLDAPCSATGTIRRNPDIPYLKSEVDIATLAAVQVRLLHRAIDWLKPDGTLVYCTCSLEPEEGERQVERFLREKKGVTLSPIRDGEFPIPKECITGEGTLRTLPWHGKTDTQSNGMDGFFAARIRKLSS